MVIGVELAMSFQSRMKSALLDRGKIGGFRISRNLFLRCGEILGAPAKQRPHFWFMDRWRRGGSIVYKAGVATGACRRKFASP
jgi:hypothetical protein